MKSVASGKTASREEITEAEQYVSECADLSGEKGRQLYSGSGSLLLVSGRDAGQGIHRQQY